MTIGDWATLIMSAAALITAGISIWKARTTMPAEVDKLRADTATQYSNLARQAADRVLEMNNRYETLEDRLDILEHNFKLAMDYVQVLLDGIDRLIHQLKANNLTPVWTPPDKPKLKDTGELKLR